MVRNRPSGDGFMTTRWTLIDLLNNPELTSNEAVRNELIEMYYPAIMRTISIIGFKRQEAEDLANTFLADKVLSRPFFERADPNSGRLRSMIVASLRYFLIDQYRKEKARPDGHAAALPENGLIEEEDYIGSINDAFERSWGTTIIEEAFDRTRRSLQSDGLDAHWAVYERTVIIPARHRTEPPKLADIIDELGFKDRMAAASAKKVVKGRVQLFLRQVIAETVSDSGDVDDEYRYLKDLFGL